MKVVVIGAGPAGLATMKELAAVGFEIEAFEAAPEIGGVFRYDAQTPGVWEDCQLTSSASLTAYSDFPPHDRTPRQMSQAEYWRYLDSYADAHRLRQYITFSARVSGVERLEGGRWRVEVVDAAGRIRTHFADSIACCTGLHQTPHVPPEFQAFAGQVLHSSQYKTPDSFRGKRVLIVGAGESGADIIKFVAEVADRCVLSLRRGVMVLPREVGGYPADFAATRLLYSLPAGLFRSQPIVKGARKLRRAILMAPARWIGRAFRDRRPSPSALPPVAVQKKLMELIAISGTSPGAQFATKSESFLYALADGTCALRRAVVGVDGHRVSFADGDTMEFDVVLCCTGFSAQVPLFPAVEPGSLFKGVFCPALRLACAFIGFVRPAIGAIPPIAEMQARLYAQALCGAVHLPPEGVMSAEVERARDAHRIRFPVNSERLPYLTDYTTYMDDLAAIVGCKPRLSGLILRPRLLFRLYCGQFLSAQYRLRGPGRNPDLARREILGLPVASTAADIATFGFYLALCKVAHAFGLRRFRPELSLSL